MHFVFHSILLLGLFSFSLLFYHSCAPGVSQRELLHPSRASDEIMKNYRAGFETSFSSLRPDFKRCVHCDKLVEYAVSPGECMFQSFSSGKDLQSETARKEFIAAMKELRGEAAQGHDRANILLGVIAEQGVPPFARPDSIAAARHYRLAADSGSLDGKAALAIFWVRSGLNLESAERFLKEALDEDPRNIPFHQYLSTCYALQGKLALSFFEAKSAYSLAPAQTAERTLLGTFYLEKLFAAADALGQKAALAEMDDLIYLTPDDRSLLLSRGQLNLRFERFDDAAADFAKFEKTLEKGDTQGTALLQKCQFDLAFTRRDYPAAHAILGTMSGTNAEPSLFADLRFALLLAEERFDDARTLVEKLRKSLSDDAPAQARIALGLMSVQIEVLTGNGDRARELAKALRPLFPDDAAHAEIMNNLDTELLLRNQGNKP